MLVGDDDGRGGARYYRRVALSTVLPGAGLLRTSWRPVGILLLVLVLAATAFVGYRIWVGGGVVDAGVDLALDPAGLRVTAAVVAVAVVLWVGSIVLTAELARPRPPRGERARAHRLRARRLCGRRAAGRPRGALPRRAGRAPHRGLRGRHLARPRRTSTVREPRVAPTPAPDPWADIPRVNLVLLGSDAGRDRVGVRTDSMMVVSVDTRTGDTLLVGVPRNLENVPIPESNPLHQLYPNGYDCGDECLMNGIWTLAESRPDLFPGNPNPGRSSTIDVLGAVTGLDLDRSVVIDLSGFRDLVDAMGGVDINVKERVCVECHLTEGGTFEWTSDRHEWLEPGVQHLDGRQALWYARSRATSDDFSRMRRQRCVAGALLEQADPVRMLARYPRIAKAVLGQRLQRRPDRRAAGVGRPRRSGSRRAGRSGRCHSPTRWSTRRTRTTRGSTASCARPCEPPATPTPSRTATTTSTPTASPSTSATPTTDPLVAEDLSRTC